MQTKQHALIKTAIHLSTTKSDPRRMVHPPVRLSWGLPRVGLLQTVDIRYDARIRWPLFRVSPARYPVDEVCPITRIMLEVNGTDYLLDVTISKALGWLLDAPQPRYYRAAHRLTGSLRIPLGWQSGDEGIFLQSQSIAVALKCVMADEGELAYPTGALDWQYAVTPTITIALISGR